MHYDLNSIATFTKPFFPLYSNYYYYFYVRVRYKPIRIFKLHCPDVGDTNNKFLYLYVNFVSSLPNYKILNVTSVLCWHCAPQLGENSGNSASNVSVPKRLEMLEQWNGSYTGKQKKRKLWESPTIAKTYFVFKFSCFYIYCEGFFHTIKKH